MDDQVKVRGHRVELGEVDAALVAHPGVRAGAAVVVGGRLVGCVVPVAGWGGGLVGGVRRFVAGVLPGGSVPGSVVVVEGLPVTVNGKTDRRALAGLVASVVGVEVVGESSAVVGGSVVEVLAGLWRRVLGVAELDWSVGFQQHGGDSLQLMTLRRRVREQLGVELPIADFFRYPTLRDQAAHLERLLGSAAPPEADAAPDNPDRTTGDEPIAIVGMACRLPGARTVEEYWRHLLAGTDLLTTPAEPSADGAASDPAGHPVAAYGPVPEYDRFDAELFGYSPREAELMDPQHRVFLETCWEALEDAAIDPHRERAAIGVFAGSGHNGYLLHNLLPNREALDPQGGLAALLGGSSDALQLLIANDKDFLATRVSYKLDLTGPSITVQSACSTSLVAVHLAVRSLRAGECRAALAGAVSLRVPADTGYWYEPGGIVSAGGRCRPFDADADGTVFTGGAGVVVLKRLGDALRDGDRIHAVVRGSAVNNDGAAKAGFTAPGVPGQQAVVRAALADAGLRPSQIGYVEAHGTGTALGDPLEVAALSAAWDALEPGLPRQGCPIGSVKGNIGHTDTVAGVAALIKAALVVRTGELPPTVNHRTANPHADFPRTPFRVVADRPARLTGTVRRAAVSSLGVGGTNAHLVLEQPPRQPPGPTAAEPQLLAVSARSAAQLRQLTERLDQVLHEASGEQLADAAHTLRTGRKALPHRAVRLAAAGARPGPAFRWQHVEPRPTDGPAAGSTVFLLPGQGVQSPGMGALLHREEPVFRAAFDDCARLLRPLTGLDLPGLLFEQPPAEAERALASTALAQPALFAVMYALGRTLEHWGVEPAALIGHSVGELAAAALAGVFELRDAVALVAERGRAMADCSPGAMWAVRAPAGEVRAALPARLTVAACNGPDDLVVAGPPQAGAEFARRCADRGWPVRRLAAERAFHTAAMAPAAERMLGVLRGVRLAPPTRLLVSTVTGRPLTAEQARDPHYWAGQVVEPVRFEAALAHALRSFDGPGTLVEVGPGRTLTQLAARRPGRHGGLRFAAPLPDGPAEPERQREGLLKALGQLWLAQAPLDWSRVALLGGGRPISLPTYPFARDRYWIGPPVAGEGTGALRGRAAEPPAGTHPAGRSATATVYTPEWARAASSVRAVAPGGDWVVYADADGAVNPPPVDGPARWIRVRPGRTYRRLGAEAFEIDPESFADHRRLLAELAGGGWKPSLLYGWPLDRTRDPVDGELAQHALLLAHQAWRSVFPALPGVLAVVGQGAFPVLGTEAVDPAQAGLAALTVVLGQEDPLSRCQYLDLDAGAPRPPATALWPAAVAARADRKVAHRGRHLWVPQYRPAQLPVSDPAPVRNCLVVGGGRLGLLLAEELAGRGAAVLLAGRSLADDVTVPPRPARAPARQDRWGGRVATARADVTRPDSLTALLDRAERELGRLDLVVHAAGTTGDAADVLLQDLAWPRARQIMAAKTDGARNLVAALRPRDFGQCVFFSSTAAVLGGVGLGAYAAGNAQLDALAAELHRQGDDRWLSLGWDTWQQSQRTPDAGIGSLGTAEALAAFHRIRAVRSGPHLLVGAHDFAARQDRWGGRPAQAPAVADAAVPAAAEDGTRRAVTGPQLPDGGADGGADGGVERALTAIWAEVLGHRHFGPQDEFRDLGGDSLAATRVAARIRLHLGRDIPLRSVLKARTLTDLTAVVSAIQGS
ncbi:type I polyketide synthase [Kitasatospora acidiphila]|uniref:type I polyketide synthase n=1 Tax=Kitasatospora acidiphila TaxID=2567942 RepID=UPI0015EFF0FC|nr:type I polyketide synthase [Kitasatospora acidiphila]